MAGDMTLVRQSETTNSLGVVHCKLFHSDGHSAMSNEAPVNQPDPHRLWKTKVVLVYSGLRNRRLFPQQEHRYLSHQVWQQTHMPLPG